MFKYRLAQPVIPTGMHNAGRAGDQLCAYMGNASAFDRCPVCFATIYPENARTFCGGCGVAVHQSDRCRLARWVYSLDINDWNRLCLACLETD